MLWDRERERAGKYGLSTLVPGSSKFIPDHTLTLEELAKLTPEECESLRKTSAKINPSAYGYARFRGWKIATRPIKGGILVTRLK